MTNFQTKKKFGQNFLKDKNLLEAICKDAEVCENDEVLEIGAGLGTLTEILANHAKKVVSYEIDSDLFPILQEKENDVLSFRFCDVLSRSLEEIESDFLGEYKIVANIPYYITTPIIFHFLGKSKKVKSMTLMVQKEVAERVVAKTGTKDYGVLSVCCQLLGKCEIKRIVDKKMFFPSPKVDSAILHITVEKTKEEFEGLFNFVKNAFYLRRKTILNSLSSAYGISKEEVSKRLQGVDLQRRAESFSIEEYKELYKKFIK